MRACRILRTVRGTQGASRQCLLSPFSLAKNTSSVHPGPASILISPQLCEHQLRTQITEAHVQGERRQLSVSHRAGLHSHHPFHSSPHLHACMAGNDINQQTGVQGGGGPVQRAQSQDIPSQDLNSVPAPAYIHLTLPLAHLSSSSEAHLRLSSQLTSPPAFHCSQWPAALLTRAGQFHLGPTRGLSQHGVSAG